MSNIIASDRHTIQDPELRTVYAQVLESLMQNDRHILSLDADLMRAIGTVKLWKQYPQQVFNCGIAEGNMVCVAAGLSSEGFVPFVHSFGAFASRRDYDQIFMSGAYAGQNIKIIGSDPGVSASLNGGTHTANEDIACMRAIPNMTIIDVTDAVMARDLLPKIAATYGMFYIRYPRGRVERVYDDTMTFQIGKAVTLRPGTDLTIIAAGMEVTEALKAADVLAQEGIQARVIDLFTIKPLDQEAVITAARETGAIVTAENHNQNGGLADAVAQCLAEHCPTPMERVANRDRFGDVGQIPYLLEEYGLSCHYIVEQARKVLARK